jgi:phage terminase small subunit
MYHKMRAASKERAMDTRLTQKQERFCLAYIETGNASEAYRRAYNTANMKPESVHRLAKALRDNIKIASRLAQLRKRAADACEVTVQKLTRELIADRELARKMRHPSAAIAASMGIAKLHGLLVEDRKNARDPFEGWTAQEINEALTHVRAAIAKAKVPA